MKKLHRNSLLLVPSIFAAAVMTSCNVEKTEDGEMPEVKVEGDAKLPEYDVDAPDVDVKMEEKTIKVPDVDYTPASEDTNDQ